MTNEQDFTQQAEKFRERYETVKTEIGKVIVGHDDIVHGVLTCMMIGGHCLLEGAPGPVSYTHLTLPTTPYV